MEHKIYFSEGLKFSIGSFELEIPIVNIDGKKCLLPPFLVIDLKTLLLQWRNLGNCLGLKWVLK